MNVCKRIVTVVLAVLFVFSIATGCKGGQTTVLPDATATPKEGKPIQGDQAVPLVFKPVDKFQPAMSDALGTFSLDLFQRMVKEDKGKNVFLSPASVWFALNMTYNGASGTTAEGMARALHAAGVPITTLNGDNSGLMGVLVAADPKITLSIANSIWMRQGLENIFNKSFLDTNKSYYDAEIKALDFSKPDSAGIINQWVEGKTNGNIKDLIEPPIDPQTVMFLINAVHFKAPWKTEFDPKKTRDGTFTTSGNTEVAARFMVQEEGNLGFANEAVTAARLPYASGRMEMVAIMPNEGTLSDFVRTLSLNQLNTIIAECKETSMNLVFPKFKLEYEKELNKPLIDMGMEEAFSGQANFKNMSEAMGDQLYISKVMHKSFIEVNEEGTEASAATSVEVRLTALPMALDFNKPFLYLIRDTRTGAILFIGTMENPAG